MTRDTIKEETEFQTERLTSNESRRKMAGLHRFKLLATRCGVAPSPTRSPGTSPVIHLRRRRTTLRSMLLGRRAPEKTSAAAAKEQREALAAVKRRNSLKDLFYSPPLEVQGRALMRNVETEKPLPSSFSSPSVRIGSVSPRPGWSGFRFRSLLLRRVWRPVLVTIPE